MTDTTSLAWFIATRNGRLVCTFLGFVVVQLLFAGLYFWLYRRRRDNFTFNDDILHRQVADIRAATEDRIARIERALPIITEASVELDLGTQPVQNKKRDTTAIILSSGLTCMTHWTVVQYGRASHSSYCDLIIGEQSGIEILRLRLERSKAREDLPSYFQPETAREWQDLLFNTHLRLQTEQKQQEARLAGLYWKNPDVWSYWDFLYFSTIVQTTVGFGDILPNRTAVRMVVATQIVIGYALLVVVLNIVLSS